VNPAGMGVEKNDWKPVKGQQGKWVAEAGDSALTLAQDANISLGKANQIIENQLGKNYEENGKVYSNVEVGDVVEIQPEYIIKSTEEVYIKFPKNKDSNLKKIDSIIKEIDEKWADYDNYVNVQRDELRDNPNVHDRNTGVIYSTQYLMKEIEKEVKVLNHIKDSLIKISKPDTIYYNVIKVIKNIN
jgi:hypothetical protein